MIFGTLVAVLGHISPGPSGVCVGEIVSTIQYQIAVAKWMFEGRISRADLAPRNCTSGAEGIADPRIVGKGGSAPVT